MDAMGERGLKRIIRSIRAGFTVEIEMLSELAERELVREEVTAN